MATKQGGPSKTKNPKTNRSISETECLNVKDVPEIKKSFEWKLFTIVPKNPPGKPLARIDEGGLSPCRLCLSKQSRATKCQESAAFNLPSTLPKVSARKPIFI
jgi:hypothetical protein